jgi:hypothetical protein
MASLIQDAFRRLGPRPCDRVMLLHAHDQVRALKLRTLSPAAGWLRPVRGKNLRDVLPRAFSVCLSAPLDDARKMLLADFCNRLTTRAPVDRVIPERVACASPTAAATRAEARWQPRRQPAFRRPSPRWSALDGAFPSFGPFDHSARLLDISVESSRSYRS